jgi:hypothetical protein
MTENLATLAFDRSARHVDVDGRLHVAASHISKATVNPYYGREIPGADALGLDPARVYQLLRHPDELAKAAPTFNNLPLLSKHVPVSALDDASHMPDLVVGSTGTDAAFNDPYLDNSLVIWAGPAVAGVESNQVRELSCAYRYVADMTPGTYKGLHYDGIMRNIVGNHVALVEAGRAGSDVIVGDSQIEGHMALTSRTAIMLSGALTALVAPRLAAGMAFDASPLVAKVTRRNYATATKDLAPRLLRTVTAKLAADEGLDVDDVIKVIGAVQGALPADEPDTIPDEPPAVDDDGDVVSRICALLEGKVDDETLASIRSMSAAPAADEYDEGPAMLPDNAPDKDKPAMDAAAIRAGALSEFNAIRQAERDVFPHVGEVLGMDSAAAVYRVALDAAKVDYTGVTGTPALRALVKMIPTPGTMATDAAPRHDASAGAKFRERFPTAQALKRA